MTQVSQLPKNKPDLRQAMTLLGKELASALCCVQIGTVKAYYPANQTADVQLVMGTVVGYTGNNAPIVKQYPMFPQIPVIFAGGGGATLTFPIEEGDTCVLMFVDRDIDSWWASGETGLPPNSNRLHNASDAVALVGLRSAVDAITDASATNVQLGGADFTGKIKLYNESMSLATIMSQLITVLNLLNSACGSPATSQITTLNDNIGDLIA